MVSQAKVKKSRGFQVVLEWLPRLATVTTPSDLDACLKEFFATIRNDDHYQIVWFGDHQRQSTSLSLDNEQHAALATGSILQHTDAHHRTWTMLPLVHVTLRGWIALPDQHQNDHLLLPVSFQTAAILNALQDHGTLVEQLHELNLFNDIGQKLTSSIEIEPLVEAIHDGVVRLLGEQGVLISIYDHDTRMFQLLAQFEHGRMMVPANPWRVTYGLTSIVIRQNAPLLTDDYLATCADHNVTPLLLRDTVPTMWAGVPMRFAERVLGVLAVYSFDPKTRYTSETIRKLEMLAHRASDNFEQARLYERTTQQARQLSLLNEIGRTITSTLNAEDVPSLIMGRVQELLDVEEGSLMLYDETTDELVFRYSLSPYGLQLLGQRIPVNLGIAGLVMRTGESLIANRAGEHPAFYQGIDVETGHQTRDLLCVPMLSSRGPVGVIELINHRNGQPFTPNDRMLLEAVADQAVIAIENANLYTRTDRALARRISELDERNRQLQEILQIGNALKASSALDAVLPRMAQAIRTTTRFNQVVISLTEMTTGHVPVLRRKAVAGIDDSIFASMRQLTLDVQRLETVLKLAYRRGESSYYLEHHLMNEQRLWDDDPPLYELPELRTGMWHPNDVVMTVLRSANGDVLGTLAVSAPMNGLQPTGDQIQTLEIFANQLVVALENEHLYSQQRQNLQGLTALSALGMAINSSFHSVEAIWQFTIGGILDWTSALGAGVLMHDDRTGTIMPVLNLGVAHIPDEQLMDQAQVVVKRSRPFTATSNLPPSIVAANGKSLLMLPLLGTHDTLGVLYLWYPEMLPPPQEQDLMSLFAGQAAVAVENMRLSAAVHEGRDRLASILASTEEGILLLSADLHLSEINSAAQKMMSRVIDAAHVIPIEQLLKGWCNQWANAEATCNEIRQGIEAVQYGKMNEARGQIHLLNPRSQWLEWSVLPVLTATKREPHSIIMVLRDITSMIEAEQLRHDLTYMMIHDLRSPLSSVMTSLDMLSKRMVGDMSDGQSKIISIALRSSVKLLDMVNLLMDISKLESGQMPIHAASTSIDSVINAVLQNYEPVLAERKVHVKLTIEPDLPLAWIDQETIERVLQNLFDNALKYSDANSTITFYAGRATSTALPTDHPAGEWLLVTVRDMGPGIPESYREKVFIKFAQLNEGVKGTGLGLTYCRLAVETHGGRIWVMPNEPPGAIFAFTVPCI